MWMFKRIVKSLIFISLFWIVYGFTIPNYEGYITDKVGIFSETEKADLTSKIEEIEKATSIEIAILVVPTVDDDINLAAVDVGNQWWVGKKGQNNGLILLIAVDDRKWSIQVGYGLEAVLPDLATKRMADARFPSNFREGNYYQGVVEMLDDALWYIKQDPSIMQNYSQDSQQTTSSSSSKEYIWYLVFLFFVISGFGRWVTVPSIKGKGRRMKKYGRRIYAAAGLALSLLVTRFLANLILSVFLSYLFLLFGVLMSLYGKSWGGGNSIRFGWTWGSSWWWWGSSFGWFGGWSFGGGWSSGSR